MQNVLKEERDCARVRKLKDLQLLDTGHETFFDRMAHLVARTLGAPIALVSLVDEDRQWVKARSGTDLKQTPRDSSFCTHTIQGDHVLVVEDATQDSRFRDLSLVTGPRAIRAYAGAPLRCPQGYKIGALCVMDTRPRTFDGYQLDMLEQLAALVADHITMRQFAERARKAEQRLIDAVDALPDGLVFYDQDDRMVLCNQRYRDIYSESADLIIPGARFEDIIRGGVERGQYPEADGQEEAWIAERVRIHQNPGDPIEQELPGDCWLRIQEGRTSEGGVIGFRFDITTQKRQERELQRLAWTDGLTDTLNRCRFLDLSRAEFSRAGRYGNPLSMLILDIDHFKQINDIHGHAAGDAVLAEIAGRWRQVLRGHDLLGRIGGEEFAALLPQTGENGAADVAEKLRRVTEAEPVRFDGKAISVTVSIGIALKSRETACIDSMMQTADQALYGVKRNGRNGLQVLAA